MTDPRPPPRQNCQSAWRRTPCCRHGCGSRAEGQVTVSPGKVEIGQGIVTALAQIAADELDVDIGRVQHGARLTAASPNEGVTSGSLSVQQSGRAIRHACAEVRQIFLAAASDRLGVGVDTLTVEDGTISGPGNVRTSYWELAEHVSLDRDATPGAAPKASAQRDAGRKLGAAARYPRQGFRARPASSTTCALPGMLHGRVLRSELSAAQTHGLKEDGARADCRACRHRARRQFRRRRQRDRSWREAALKALRKGATWSAGEALPDEDQLASFLKAQPSEPRSSTAGRRQRPAE